jgi:hypothetical protein
VCTRLIIFIAPKHENFRDTPGRPLVSKKRGKNLWLPSGYHWYTLVKQAAYEPPHSERGRTTPNAPPNA